MRNRTALPVRFGMAEFLEWARMKSVIRDIRRLFGASGVRIRVPPGADRVEVRLLRHSGPLGHHTSGTTYYPALGGVKSVIRDVRKPSGQPGVRHLVLPSADRDEICLLSQTSKAPSREVGARHRAPAGAHPIQNP